MSTGSDRDEGPPADGRVRRGRDTRERLLAAARDQFGARGYEGTSIESVLETAEVARGALYHHFNSKTALFDAVLDRLIAEIAQAAGMAARDASDPLESLRIGCFTWLDATLDPAVQRIALLDAMAVVGWTRCREIDEAHILGGLLANLERLAAQGRLPAQDVTLMAHMVLAAVNEAALLLARSDVPQTALDAGRATVDTLLTRIAHDPGDRGD